MVCRLTDAQISCIDTVRYECNGTVTAASINATRVTAGWRQEDVFLIAPRICIVRARWSVWWENGIETTIHHLTIGPDQTRLAVNCCPGNIEAPVCPCTTKRRICENARNTYSDCSIRPNTVCSCNLRILARF